MSNPTLNLQRIYVKYSSFSVKDAPQVFRVQKPLKHTIEMKINHQALAEEHHYEVVLSLQVTANKEDQESKEGEVGETVFVGKIDQAGIFKIENVTKEQLEQIANTHCPNMLYPYACSLLTQLVVSGSFPGAMMQPVSFESLYRQSKEKGQEAAPEKLNG